ncbi:hypothetical protein BC937DRAFT_88845 [Endogone sp. FLAS-F59071]|nr:hypothetical protein BC937DRAFT_88845 [Endogone sp. FLAS-F59071]|eukprot:RUS22476.1 hypothetical protein BC937DRAFT_88845 [Endogone sp. FLAS-F59071]
MSTMSIQSLAQEWLRLDRNPETRKEIETLLNNNNEKELQKRLEKRMEFGTAGVYNIGELFCMCNDIAFCGDFSTSSVVECLGCDIPHQ